MPTSIASPDLLNALQQAQSAALRRATKNVSVNSRQVSLPFPFPSPGDWRDCWIYFVLLDRFANDSAPPRGTWNQVFSRRQGGTFACVRSQLAYLADLGARAIWLSPVLKNSRPNFDYNYHGYATQDFVNVDERFASDGTRATAERELADRVDAAHARGLFVILDVVLNHAGRVFDYQVDGAVASMFAD